MNWERIVGLILIALLAAWLVLRGCSPEPLPPEVAPPPPSREIFHVAKPLRVIVTAQPDPSGKTADTQWLEQELRYLLARGKMRVASGSAAQSGAFALSVDLSPQNQVTLALLAPDQFVERRETIAVTGQDRFDLASALAAQLPEFLGAVHANGDWTALLGTQDRNAYQAYTRNSIELLGHAGLGFTRPPPGAVRIRTVERVEALTRQQPRFARAWALLAAGYLSLGGEDEASLTQLAESSAKRALTLDADLAEAHAAMGLVHLRRAEWIAAREQLDRALALDSNAAPALEGLACLLVDAGQNQAALAIADRAVAIQPSNGGARECQAYAQSASASLDGEEKTAMQPAVARVYALVAVLDGDLEHARQLVRRSSGKSETSAWADPVLRAAGNRKQVPEALRAITSAASEGRIDASTEILAGAALRQSDFVFNRMARLQRLHAHMPLRLLWLPQTDFLRKHERFEEIIGAVGLPALWQQQGPADICKAEPATYGCRQ